jgi:hypothetical protein
MKKLVILTALGALPVLATPQVCAIFTGGEAAGLTVSSTYIANQMGQANEGCNDLITFNANGSITTTNPNPTGFYDSGGDDNIVGIINNTSNPILSINLSSTTTAIFGFDGDGMCDTGAPTGTTGWGPGGSGFSFSALGAGGTTGGCVGSVASVNGFFYLPAGVTASGVNAAQTTGTINFAGGIAPGGSAYFSLEGPVDVNLKVMPGVPEPGSIVLVGGGLGMLGLYARRRLKA